MTVLALATVRIAVWSNKGGTGKTTTALELAYGLGKAGRAVTLVDLDPQARATKWLVEDGPESGIRDVLLGTANIKQTKKDLGTIGLVAGNGLLARIDSDLADEVAPQMVLRNAIKRETDTLVFDCPPQFGTIPILALAAANRVVVPITAGGQEWTALEESVARIEQVREALNPKLGIGAIVLCMADRRTALLRVVRQAISAKWPEVPLYEIPAATATKMASGAHVPLSEYAPLSPAAIAYQDLVHEVMEWL